jgi:glycerol uptake facilitator-like aquaporin
MLRRALLAATRAEGVSAEQGCNTVVMVSLGSGRLVKSALSRSELEPLGEFSAETWAQALLKFVLSDGRVSCAILPPVTLIGCTRTHVRASCLGLVTKS